MSEKQYVIVLTQGEVWWRSLISDVGTFIMFLSLIGLGILLESSAMQWVGAIIGFLTIFVKVVNSGKVSRYDINGARARLDEIEAEQRKTP